MTISSPGGLGMQGDFRMTLAIALTLLAGCDASNSSASNRKRVVVEPAEVTIEMNGANQVETTRFRIRNMGVEAFSIKNVTASCGCTSAEVDSKLIAPGKEATLTARIKPINVGSNTIRIESTTDLVEQPVLSMIVSVKGNGKVPYVASVPTSLNFGDISGNHATVPFFVETRESATSKPGLMLPRSNTTDISLEGGWISDQSVGNGIVVRRYEYVAAWRKSKSTGHFRDEIVLRFANPESDLETRVPVNGSVLHAVQVSPGAIFGSFSKFEEVPAYSITFRNISKPDGLEIEPMNSDAKRFAIEKIGDAKDAVTFRIRVTEPFGKELDTVLAFRTNAEEMPEIKLPVRLKIRE